MGMWKADLHAAGRGPGGNQCVQALVARVRPLPLTAPFRFLLFLEDGEPADPAVFVTRSRDWSEGETFVASNGRLFVILVIHPHMSRQAAEQFDGAWTVEPVAEPLA